MTFEPLPDCTIERDLNEIVHEDDQDDLTRAKFVDDVSTAEAVNINKLTLKTSPRIIGPLPFRDSSDFELAPGNSLLQTEICKAKKSSDDLKMILNAKKTKIFAVNYSDNYQFKPRFRVPGNNTDLEVVTSVKLVGVTLSANLKFHEHVNSIVKSANKKIWMLRRLKEFGFSEKDLIEIYTLFIRSRLEYCVPAWNASLTETDKEEIERIQKTMLKIVHGEDYEEYANALEKSNLTTLEERREELCLSFALKCTSDPKHKKLFQLNENSFLHHPDKFKPPFCQNERYAKSPVPYLTNLLNKYYQNLKKT